MYQLMKFKESRPIYLQIADRICDEIHQGIYPEDGRIPSVREYAEIVEVNANTVMRSYDYLQMQEIIYNKRGIGYFVGEEAKNRILSARKEQFMDNEIEYFFRQLRSLGVSGDDLVKMYNEYCKQNKG